MADQAAAPEQGQAQGSTRSVILGSSIVLWILAVFMIVTLNKMNTNLKEIKLYLQAVRASASVPLTAYEVRDKDDNLLYKFGDNPYYQITRGAGPGPRAGEAPMPPPPEEGPPAADE